MQYCYFCKRLVVSTIIVGIDSKMCQRCFNIENQIAELNWKIDNKCNDGLQVRIKGGKA